jgi:hypothetical protein
MSPHHADFVCRAIVRILSRSGSAGVSGEATEATLEHEDHPREIVRMPAGVDGDPVLQKRAVREPPPFDGERRVVEPDKVSPGFRERVSRGLART